MAEFLLRPQKAKQALQARPVWPRNGKIDLPVHPGLGVELADDRIDTRQTIER